MFKTSKHILACSKKVNTYFHILTRVDWAVRTHGSLYAKEPTKRNQDSNDQYDITDKEI